MGIFKIEIKGSGGHGCERTSGPGEKLFKRCGKFTCPDCMAFDFVQILHQKGFSIGEALFTHHVGAVNAEVVDDMLKNERRSGRF